MSPSLDNAPVWFCSAEEPLVQLMSTVAPASVAFSNCLLSSTPMNFGNRSGDHSAKNAPAPVLCFWHNSLVYNWLGLGANRQYHVPNRRPAVAHAYKPFSVLSRQ